MGIPRRPGRLRFKLLAAVYDLCDLPFRLRPTENPRLILARHIPDQPLDILDVCAGAANAALAVAAARPRCRVIGIDSSPEMLAAAARKIKDCGQRNITIQLMQAERLAFRDGAFDVVTISLGLHELEPAQVAPVLQEMRRVLKDSGCLYIVDYARQTGMWRRLILETLIALFEPKHVAQFMDTDWHAVLAPWGLRVFSIEECLFTRLIGAAVNR